MTPALTHLALHVRDLEACIAFYRDFCGLKLVHEREDAGSRVVWLAEPGREKDFIIVLLPGGPGRDQQEGDFSHLGFALDSKDAVDTVAARGQAAGCLAWAPRSEEHTSELQSLMRISYAVFCLKKKKTQHK